MCSNFKDAALRFASGVRAPECTSGISVLSSISVSDLSISLSLPLEVEYQDKNTYSCVLNNPISNQTTHLDINTLCHTCADSVHCCGPTEAVIRLVLSALVGVATVIIVVYEIRSRRAERDQANIHTSGLFGVEVKSVSVTEGDSVTLNSETELQTHDLIMWTFGRPETLIAHINKKDKIFSTSDVPDGRFRDRLKLDHQTGSLIITNTTTEHAGRYQLTIKGRRKITYRFSVTVYGVFGVEVKSVSVTEGDSVTLNSETELQTHDLIMWTFGRPETLIAVIDKEAGIFSISDRRFRDRLKLDHQTGSLTITNTRTTDSGEYEVTISGMTEITYRFSVSLNARLPVPVIISNSSNCSSSSSSSNCSLGCSSVVNVSHVTLSWYKGISVLSSISASDLSISLSLPLEVEYQDKNPYSCVLNNPISNQTTHLDINTLCHTCADSVHCCGPTEAVIRLVLSALVGVATVIIVLYEIRGLIYKRCVRTKEGVRRSLRNNWDL
ncbi:unnamed protein product [Leuciscus chuanchicus]